MQIYLDTANLDEIRASLDLGICDGVTTNPTLIAKEKKTVTEAIKGILEILPLKAPLSVEIISTTYYEMLEEAFALYDLDDKHKKEVFKDGANREEFHRRVNNKENVDEFYEEVIDRSKSRIVVKIPITEEGLKVIRMLENEAIPNMKTNATLCFSVPQALMVAKVRGSYVSPFVGRMDDIGITGMQIVADIKQVFSHYKSLWKTKIIVASIRNPLHIIDCARLGVDIATIPFKVIQQLLKHPLTDNGIKKFLEDYGKIPK